MRMTKEEILAAIRRTAEELGRAPSRGELRRITGVSHYRVLAEFRTLREAVRAAGLEPNPKGEKIRTEDLLADWKRVAEKLGRRPSRAEYVREGKYSAGALTVRFGSWGRISTAKDAKSAKKKLPESPNFHTSKPKPLAGDPGLPKNPKLKNVKAAIAANGARYADCSDKAIAMGWVTPVAQLPAPLVGMRRVTEEVAQMVVNTLLSPANARAAFAGGPDFVNSNWQLAISQRSNQPSALSIQPGNIYHGDTEARRAAEENGRELTRNTRMGEEDLAGSALARRGIKKDRPVMGEPFDRSPMTNAPVNELGVMVLFGMVAAGLGLQVESVQGKFPDCMAKRQVAPGKWQYLRIEFEYESKNFRLHGHDPKGCDMIVCWRHNWKECPAEIEVVELSRLVGWR